MIFKLGMMPILVVIILMASLPGVAQLNINITLNKNTFVQGDTIRLSCVVPEWRGTQKIGTLEIFFEDVNHVIAKRLRYPVLQGLSEGDLVISDSFPNGLYAMYFQLQDAFWGVDGQIDNRYKSKKINYTLMLEDGTLVSGDAAVDEKGRFKLARHVFPGQAKLYFTEIKKAAVNDELNLSIRTPLDSINLTLADTLLFFSIGEVEEQMPPESYRVLPNLFSDTSGTSLRNVTVTAKAKTPIEAFDEEFSTGQFKNKDAYIIDLLSNNFTAYSNVLDYLVGRIPGFTAYGSLGSYTIRWRGETPSFFLDEIPIFPESLFSIPFSDIAMVKAFRTPMVNSFLGGSGNVIAIYTKRGGGAGLKAFKNKFPVNGYTPLLEILKKPATD